MREPMQWRNMCPSLWSVMRRIKAWEVSVVSGELLHAKRACEPNRLDMAAFYREHDLLLAPMAGITDRVFRQLCREQGAKLAFTEMVSAKGLSYANEKTAHLVDLGEGETEVGVQLFGHEPGTMASQAVWLRERLGDALAVVDINMGCPVRKIAGKGDGASLMQRPDEAAAIVRAVADAIDVPVTVKFRRGFAMDDETAPEFARRMEDAGAAAITVHGRFAQQMYRGQADWGVISRVVQSVSIPVVGNGDVRSGADAVRMREQTGCAAVMVARAARGNPWIFAQCAAALAGVEAPAPPTVQERLSVARRHADMLEAAYGRRIVKMRTDAMWYVAGIPGAAAARRELSACTTAEEFNAAFDKLERHYEASALAEQ
ncbi:MAG: tRNA dihydrouridine synthase DusB [Coriobacteriia bacterium]|nr:tRNA dihydrouridine synthase DusB [Coriobacteriia bacterium]